MKRSLFLFLLLIGASTLVPAQLTIPNDDFESLTTLSCPFQDDVTVSWPEGWMIYQTDNNLWDGTIDSSRCISADMTTGSAEVVILLDQIDPEKALFIRQSFPGEAGLPLQPDYVYETSSVLRLFNAEYTGDDECNGTICSGVINVVEIPDETGLETTDRIYTANFSGSLPVLYAQSCLATEYFEQQTLREYILKVTFSGDVSEGRLELRGTYVQEPCCGVVPVTEIVFPDASFDGEAYQAHISATVPSPGTNPEDRLFLVMHEPDVYPGPGNITYVEARPETPVSEPVDLSLRLNWFETLVFQPFTALRGALVEAGDTARHHLTIIVEETDLCISNAVDLVVADDTEFEFRSGNINFNGPNSCLMFRNGGTLSIPDDERFVYGRDGIGLLGLDVGAQIKVGKNSELVINNTALLPNYLDSPDRQVYLELLPGSRLTFGEQARLIRKGHVEDGHMMLNVYMKGGVLDDSRLSARDRRLINRIYAPESNSTPDWLRVLGNPAKHAINFTVDARQAEIPVSWSIRNLNGRPLQSGVFTSVQGVNRHEINLEALTSGMYLLEVEQQAERIVRKFVVLP